MKTTIKITRDSSISAEPTTTGIRVAKVNGGVFKSTEFTDLTIDQCEAFIFALEMALETLHTAARREAVEVGDMRRAMYAAKYRDKVEGVTCSADARQ